MVTYNLHFLSLTLHLKLEMWRQIWVDMLDISQKWKDGEVNLTRFFNFEFKRLFSQGVHLKK